MRSAGCRMLQAGSLRSPESRISRSCGDSSAQIQDRHTHGQTVGHLIENDALISVRQLAVDLDSAIDRPGMHDQTIGLQQFRALLVKPKSLTYSPMPGKYSLRCRSCWMRSRLTTSAV